MKRLTLWKQNNSVKGGENMTDFAGIKVVSLLVLSFMVLCGTSYALPVIDGIYDIGSGEYDSEVYMDGPVGPGGGGQGFDVELMGLSRQGTTLCFGLRTGFDLTGGSGPDGLAIVAGQKAGDLFFDFNGDGFFETAIRFGTSGPINESPTDPWSDTVSLDLYTGYAPSALISPTPHPGLFPWALDTTGLVATALAPGVIGRHDWSNGTTLPGHHQDNSLVNGDSSYVLESCFDISNLWNGRDPITFHWTMLCGNDGGDVTTPEPASILMACGGLFGVAMGRRRLQKWLK
jgi:hypothetical protein